MAARWRNNPVRAQITYTALLVATGIAVFVAGALERVKLLEVLGAVLMIVSPYIAVALTVRRKM